MQKVILETNQFNCRRKVALISEEKITLGYETKASIVDGWTLEPGAISLSGEEIDRIASYE